jgi:hypothetical protein
MPPVAIARLAHDLPGLPVKRQRLRAGHAAPGIKADRPRRKRCRRGLAAEQLLGRRPRIIGLGKRRQRLGVDAAQVLRGCGHREQRERKHNRDACPRAAYPCLQPHRSHANMGSAHCAKPVMNAPRPIATDKDSLGRWRSGPFRDRSGGDIARLSAGNRAGTARTFASRSSNFHYRKGLLDALLAESA